MIKFLHAAISFSIIVGALVATYSTAHGYSTVISNPVMSWGGAIGLCTMVAVFWLFMTDRYPKANPSERKHNLALMMLALVIVFGTSSYWSIIAFGGREAVRTHQDATLEAADRQALQLYQRQAAIVASTAQFDTLAGHYRSMAKAEERGAYSGSGGHGSVYNSALNMANLLEGLVKKTADTDRDYRRMYESFKVELGKARKIVSDIEKADQTDQDKVRGLNLEFSSQLGALNEITARMKETSSDNMLRTTVQSLTNLTEVSNANDSVGQKSALEALRRINEETQKTLTSVVGSTGANYEIEIQTFTTISPARAVFVYIGSVFYAWFFGIGLDIFPMLFIFAASINRRSEEEEDKDRQESAAGPRRVVGERA